MPHPDTVAGLSSEEAVERLRVCLSRMSRGSWKFVQLRGPAPHVPATDGDVDLLGTAHSVYQLLKAAQGWVREGLCHLRFAAKTSSKAELTLISLDGRESIQFDLWVELWQLDNGRQCLRYTNLKPLLSIDENAIQRMPVDLEACVYVHHLGAKKKKLEAARAQGRLAHYREACRSADLPELASQLEQIRERKQILPADRQGLLKRLEAATGTRFEKPATRRRDLFQKLRTIWLAPPRQRTHICIMGCDGAGKTTLAEHLAGFSGHPLSVYTGKHLYRKSWLYKLAVIFVRPLLRSSREDFDERLAPLAYLRACLGLRLRLATRRRGLTIIDRSLADFLYVGRKTDAPRFSRCKWLTRFMGRQLPTVHCLVSHDVVLQRKQEVTRQGHERYDADMLEHFAQLRPVDYLAFYNEQSLPASVAALEAILFPDASRSAKADAPTSMTKAA